MSRLAPAPLVRSTMLVACLAQVAGCSATMHRDRTDDEVLFSSADTEIAPRFDSQGLSETVFSAHPIERVGLMWDAPDGTAIEGRFADEDQRWSTWQRIDASWVDEETGLARVGDLNADIEAAHHFQLRLAGGEAPSFVLAERVDAAGPLAKSVHADLEPQDEVTQADDLSAIGQLRFSLTVPGLTIIRRSQWGSKGARCSYGSHRPKRVTFHHTDTPYYDSISAKARVRQIQSYHKNVRRFCDIGYHFLIDRDGNIYEGTLDNKKGAHVKDKNTDNLGISFIGNYNGGYHPSSHQRAQASRLLAGIRTRWGVTLNRTQVRGHRQYRGNSRGDCPGDNVYSKLSAIIAGATSGGGSSDNNDDDDNDSNTDSYDTCVVGTAKGKCLDVNATSCDSGFKSGYCMGANNIKCCLDDATSTAHGVGTTCNSGSRSGTCMDKTISSCSTGFKSGLCPGPSVVKCCLD